MARRKGKAEADLPTREQILAFMRDNPGKAGKREIARAFGIKSGGRIALKRLLREMTDEGLIEGSRRKLRKPGTLSSVEVLEVADATRDGNLFAVPADWDRTDHGDPPRVRLEPETGNRRAGRAPAVGDRVLVRIQSPDKSAGRPTLRGRVIRTLERRPATQIGVFEKKSGGGGWIRSVSRKQLKDMQVLPGAEAGARDGELVRVSVGRSTRLGPPVAEIQERLGDARGEKAVSLITLVSHEIPVEFPDSAIAETEAAKPATQKGRTDIRKLPLITIDPADAEDHDDAVHARRDQDRNNPDGWIVTVAIADVAAYVTPRSSLDREARKRGNSVYFPDRVVPMLPERISNDLCSLREGEDRPALAVELVFGADGKKRSHRFDRVLMRSAAKLSYQAAQAAIDGKPDETSDPLLDTVLKPLWEAYRVAAKGRAAREPLDLDLPERKLALDDKGRVERVIVPPRLDAHKLIDEFMIQANVAAAETLEKHKSPLLYRVHDAPSPEKLAELADFLRTIGIKLPKSGTMKPHHFNGILAAAAETEHTHLVNEVVLRSQAQAEYSAENYGHFGLSLRRYAHFTSPIRRYADLIVHRALIAALDLGKDGLTDPEIEALDETAAQISATERRAMLAERETVDRLISYYLVDRVGAQFRGRISGVTRSGLFVKLADTGADGFIPASTIGADYYRHDEEGQRMIGDQTGETYRLGDDVEVRLVEAAPLAGALRFELVSEGSYTEPRKRPRRQGRRRK